LKKIVLSILVLLIVSPGFAEDIAFTNEDLIIYSDEYRNYRETAHFYEDNKENTSTHEKGAVTKPGTDGSKDKREGQPKNLTGESCDVLDSSSHTINYAVHNPDYEISGMITKQTVTVSIKNKWDLPLLVENFYIVAFLEDGTKQTKQLQPAPGDSLTTLIQPDSEYAGDATFDGDLQIISVGCHVIQ
jgi:hypothetical protein